MPLKSIKPKSHKAFSGFVVYYDNGKIIKERENFFSKILNKKCATNWAEIDKSKLVKIELLWKDELKGYIARVPDANSFNKTPITSPQDWFFSQSGYFDMGSKEIVVVSRNIGYNDSGILNIFSVIEESGIVTMHRRAAK